MVGVEILTSAEVATEFSFNWIAFWIAGTIIMGLIISLGIISWKKEICSFGIVPALSVVGIIGGIVVGFLVGAITSKPIEYVTEYQVTVSDEVTLNEFNEKYEIVKQDGKIYTVREK